MVTFERSADGSVLGWKATEVFSQGVTYSYDDIILLPGYISFGADDVGKSETMVGNCLALGLRGDTTHEEYSIEDATGVIANGYRDRSRNGSVYGFCMCSRRAPMREVTWIPHRLAVWDLSITIQQLMNKSLLWSA